MCARFYAYTRKSAWYFDISHSSLSRSLSLSCQVVDTKLTMQRAFTRWQRRRATGVQTFPSERAIIRVAGCWTAPCTLSTTSPLPSLRLQSEWPLECREDFFWPSASAAKLCGHQTAAFRLPGLISALACAHPPLSHTGSLAASVSVGFFPSKHLPHWI